MSLPPSVCVEISFSKRIRSIYKLIFFRSEGLTFALVMRCCYENWPLLVREFVSSKRVTLRRGDFSIGNLFS